jgi:hypothetical protein
VSARRKPQAQPKLRGDPECLGRSPLISANY